MTHKTMHFTFPESSLPKTGNVIVSSESTGAVLGKATVSDPPDKPMIFLRVSPEYFDIVGGSMFKPAAVLKVAHHIMKNIRFRNFVRLKHRDVSLDVGFSARTVARCLVDLQKVGLIAHRRDLDVSTYMVNPVAAWYGSGRDIPKAVKEFTAARKASGYFVPEPLSDPAGEPTPDTE